jgi:hypothetical protein
MMKDLDHSQGGNRKLELIALGGTSVIRFKGSLNASN